jgi:undecaprenyl-diphosphatase
LVGLGLLHTRAPDDVWPMTVEDDLNRYFEQWRTPVGNGVSLVMSELGNTATIIAIYVLAIAVLRWRLGRWRESLLVALSTVGQSLVFYFTTLVIDRDRPDVAKLDESPPTSSLPSGHTSASIALYTSLAIVVHRTVARAWLRRLLVVLLLSAPIMVWVSRLDRGMHHPSDLVGALVNAALVNGRQQPEGGPGAGPAPLVSSRHLAGESRTRRRLVASGMI